MKDKIITWIEEKIGIGQDQNFSNLIGIGQSLKDVPYELQHVAETLGFIDIDIYSKLACHTVDHEGELDIAMWVLALETAVLVIKRQRCVKQVADRRE